MNALTIIEQAATEGLVVRLSPGGSLKAIGNQEAVNRWRPVLTQHKLEIINLLVTVKPGGAIEATRPTVPDWCNTKCEHFHRMDVPEIGTFLWCCQEEDPTYWCRLRINSMNECPIATQKR